MGPQLNQGTLEELPVLEVVEVSSVFGTGQKYDLPELLDWWGYNGIYLQGEWYIPKQKNRA